MSRSYPRYAGKIRLGGRELQRVKDGALICACCPLAPIGYADIQYSWFRSDDTAYPVCEDHRRLASSNVKAFIDLLSGRRTSAPSAEAKP